uniref:Rap-GAP domain-containing protein n=1 Tax=Mesocestoides corti TaxID=53468 RepID=A0A5K3F3Z6_MESCO
MFRRNKKPGYSEENSKKKFLSSKESAKKVKHLKLLAENLPDSELQSFFEEHHSEIFHNFLDHFDTEVRNKLSTCTPKECECQLLILEKLLVYLPERFNSQWQLKCLLDLVQDMLHPSKPIAVQVNGMRIFLLWYQILGENAIPACTDVFIHLVPEFGKIYNVYKSPKLKPSNTVHQIPVSFDGDGQKECRNAPIHPGVATYSDQGTLAVAAADEQKNLILLRFLLRFSVTEVDKILWNPEPIDRRTMCFWFLFEQLKRYYFPAIFPKISAKYSLYDGGVLPSVMSHLSDYSPAPDGYPISPTRLAIYQEEVVQWLSEFLYNGPLTYSPNPPTDPRSVISNDSVGGKNPRSREGSISGVDLSSQSDLQFSSANDPDHRNTFFTDGPALGLVNELSPSQPQQRVCTNAAAALSPLEISQSNPGYSSDFLLVPRKAVSLEPVPSSLPVWDLNYSPKMVSRVREILFYSRQNVNLIHAVFYHAFLLPLDRYKTLFRLVLVYRSWLDDKPVFMKNVETKLVSAKGAPQIASGQNSNLKDTRRRHESGPSAILQIRSAASLNPPSLLHQPPQAFLHSDVGGCMQTTFQVMFTNVSHIFLRVCPPACVTSVESGDRVLDMPVDFVSQQIALCTFILDNIIQPLTQSNALNTESWEKLLSTLIHIISEVMSKIYRSDLFDFHWVSNDSLLSKMFQTLNTASIYATLAAPISATSWDSCLEIYSKWLDCPALFREWKKTMDLLTRQFSKIVFGVNLNDLPNESKTKRGRRTFGVTSSGSSGLLNSKMVEKRGLPTNAVANDASIAVESADTVPDNSGVEFSLTTGSDEADATSSDGIAESSAAIDGIAFHEITNTSDGCSSDVDCEPHDNYILVPSMDLHSNDTTKKGSDDCTAVSFSYAPSRLRSRSVDRTGSINTMYPTRTLTSSNGLYKEGIPRTVSVRNITEHSKKFQHSRVISPKHHSHNIHRKFHRPHHHHLHINSTKLMYSPSSPSNGTSVVVTDAYVAKRQPNEVGQSNHLSGTMRHVTTLTRSPDAIAISRNNSLVADPKASSVLAGGKEPGWNADSALVCWRRFLGLLGDFSQLSNPTVMVNVFVYLDSLIDSLVDIDAYQPLELAPNGAFRPPTTRPPFDYLVPVFLRVLQMPPQFNDGKKIAIRILKKMLIRQQDIEQCKDILAPFYRILHQLLVRKEENFAAEVIRSDCWKMFAYSLPACSLLTLDFIQATDEIFVQPALHDEDLRAQAMSVLVALLPLQQHFGSLKAFKPSLPDLTIGETGNVMPLLASRLFRGVVAETSEKARQVAICGIMHLCFAILIKQSPSRMCSAEQASTVHTGLVTLLRCTRLANRAVALTAMGMLRALTEYSEAFFDLNPTYPALIIKTLAWNLAFLWSQVRSEEKISPTFKMLLTANISALMEWTVKIPLPLLTSPFTNLNIVDDSNRKRSKEITCLWIVFSVLEYISSSTSLSHLEPAGPGWVPGFPLPDPLADEGESKFAEENAAERQLDSLEIFADQSCFLAPIPLTPECIRVAARFARCHLFSQIGRYPLSSTNDVIDSHVQEHHNRVIDPNSLAEELTFDYIDQPNVQIFVVNRSFLVSLFTVDSLSTKANSLACRTDQVINSELLLEDTVTDLCDVRVIVRDISGKYVWDATRIQGLLQRKPPSPPPRQRPASCNDPSITMPIHTDLQSTPSAGTGDQSIRAKFDFLSELLEELASKHPDFRSQIASEVSEEASLAKTSKHLFDHSFEKLACERITAAKMYESQILDQRPEVPPLNFYGTSCQDLINTAEMERWSGLNQQYTIAKRLLCQLGFLSQNRRPSLELLNKSWGLVREIKNLDKQRSRQTYKIALVYVGPGQEEKQEILSNPQGSLEFERFASGLGWHVKLADHQGFTGGLQFPVDGETATYFSTSTIEVIFHVSTQMPSATDEDRHRMFKHLGNDEVMIIWTEHWRPFRRSSLRTEFGDVLIIISPQKSGLFRVEIRKEPEVPFFGPLVDGTLVAEDHLPFLVRATAIQASNALNSRKPNFKEHFEERCFYLQSIINNHTQNTAFEDFVMQVALPKLPPGTTL